MGCVKKKYSIRKSLSKWFNQGAKLLLVPRLLTLHVDFGTNTLVSGRIQTYHILFKICVWRVVGGSVLSVRCTETYNKKNAQYYIFGYPIWSKSSNDPKIALEVTIHF